MNWQGKSIVKFSMITLSIIFIFSLLQVVMSNDDKVEAAENEHKIVGYYPSWAAYGRDYQVADMDVSNVTHINYAFADICWDGKHGNPDPEGPNPQTWTCKDENGSINPPNGSIVLGDPWIDIEKSFPGDNWDDELKGNINQLIQLKEKNPHLKTIISVGGWTWSNRFSDVAASAETRENFANSAVDFLRKYQFDGIDLDWEYPVSGGLPGNSTRPEDKQNHVLLLQAVRDKLDAAEKVDGREYELTIASKAGPDYVENNKLGEIANVVDWINIMSYDFNGGWQSISGHNAPLHYDPEAKNAGVPNAKDFNVESSVQGHLDAGVPPEKLVLGTPFYGRGWDGCDNINNGEYQNCDKASKQGTWEDGVFDYTDLEDNFINKNGYTRYWNDTANVPYLYNSSNGTFISYDDEESIGYKTDFIKSKGLAGAMFWEFSGDRNTVLLDKLTSDLSGPVIKDEESPTVPSNFRSTDKGSRSIDLSWDASTDNIDVKEYIVSYGSETVSVNGTHTTISNLSPQTSYTFTVVAKDAAGNQSNASKELNVTTNESSDPVAPSSPTNIEITKSSASSISLNWTASTDNVGVTGYTVQYGNESIVVLEANATIEGLNPEQTYTFNVTARDAEGNVSDPATIEATTKAGSICTEIEWVPSTAYTGGDQVAYKGKLYEAKWWTQGDKPDQNSSDSGVWKLIQDCGTDSGNGNGNGSGNGDGNGNGNGNGDGNNQTCAETSWDSGSTYTQGDRVVYKDSIYKANFWTKGDKPDQSSEWGPWSFVEDCSVVEDTEAPTVPQNIVSSNVTTNSVTLNWDASTDNVATTAYDVFKDDALATTVSDASATISGLKANSAYHFTVQAKDAAGNSSAISQSIEVTTAKDNGGQDPTPTGSHKYVTYASTWDTSISDLTTENIPNYVTSVNLAFARPNTNYVKGSYEFDQEVSGFEFVEGASTPNGQKKFTDQEKTELIDNIDALEQRGTEVWLSVGGWAYSQGSQWEDFSAPHVVDLALDLGASGIDIDWESSGSNCNKETAATFSCTGDDEIANIITNLNSEIQSRNVDLGISIAGWSTGAYYVEGTPFEEGNVQWGSPFGGTMYNVVKNHGDKIDMINLMAYDGGNYYDPREGYESYRAIYDGPINMGMEIAPEGSGGAELKLHAEDGVQYDGDLLTGENNIATPYYNVETLVDYMKNEGKPFDGFMLWQLWKQRVHQPAPAGAATENSAGQYVCENYPLEGTCSQTIPDLPKATP